MVEAPSPTVTAMPERGLCLFGLFGRAPRMLSCGQLPFGHHTSHGLARLKRAVLAFEPNAPERVTHVAVRLGEPQRDAARAQRPMQLGKQLGTGEIDRRHGAEKEHHEAYVVGPRGEEIQQTLAYMVHVEVDEGR